MWDKRANTDKILQDSSSAI